MSNKQLKFNTLQVHAGQTPDPTTPMYSKIQSMQPIFLPLRNSETFTPES